MPMVRFPRIREHDRTVARRASARGHFQGDRMVGKSEGDAAQSERDLSALAQEVALLQEVLDSTEEGLLVVDAAGAIVRWNRRFAELWLLPGIDPHLRRGQTGSRLRAGSTGRSRRLHRPGARALCSAPRPQRGPPAFQGPPGFRTHFLAAPGPWQARRENLEFPGRHPTLSRRDGTHCGLQRLAGGALGSPPGGSLSVDPRRHSQTHASGEFLHRAAGQRHQPHQLSLFPRSARGSAAASEPGTGPDRIRPAHRPTAARFARCLRQSGRNAARSKRSARRRSTGSASRC